MKYTKEEVKRDLETIHEIYRHLRQDIVYETQEGQEDHFDKWPKAEQMMLYSIIAHLGAAQEALAHYEDWVIHPEYYYHPKTDD